MKKTNLLFITELFPYPPTSGAKIKCINTIQTLSNKFNITLVTFSEKEVLTKDLAYVKKFANHIKVFILPKINKPPQDDLKVLIKNYLKLNPYFIYQFYSKEAKDYINELIIKLKPKIIHTDHINMVQYLPKNKNEVWILEEQNIEYQLAWMKFINYPELKKTKLHLLIEYFFVSLFERKILKKFDHIFAISKYDEQILKDKLKLNNVSTQKLVYPPNHKSFKNKSPFKKELLFIGDITWLPNKLAVRWFVKRIFPLIIKKEPKVILNIVGEIEEVFIKELHLNYKKEIKIHKFQNNLEKFLKTPSVFILPFQAGGGVRIKALTALSHQLSIVSTQLGMQGIDGENLKDYLVAKNAKEFAKYCLLLIRNLKIRKRIAKNGFEFLKKSYSNKNNSTFIKEYLEVTQ